MYELIICAAVAWGGACQDRRAIIYPSKYFCERAIATAPRPPKVTAIYCRPKP